MIGKITVTCNPSIERSRKLRLVQKFNRMELCEEAEDVTILCQEQIFKFSKMYLSSISPVFKNMFNKNEYIESEDNIVKIVDVEPDTIQAFKNVLYNEVQGESSSSLVVSTSNSVAIKSFPMSECFRRKKGGSWKMSSFSIFGYI